MQLNPQLVLTIVAVGTALLRLIPKAQPLVTLYLPPKWRTVPAIALALIGLVVGVAQAGADVNAITVAFELALGAIVAIFAPGSLPAGAVAEPGPALADAKAEVKELKAASKAGSIPPTAALLLLGLVGLGQTACAARLNDLRPTTELRGLSIAGVALEQPGSPRCQTLDDRQLALGVSGYTLTALGAATAGGILVPGESDELRVGLAIGAVAATATGGGLLWGQRRTAEQWLSEGCSGSPAP